MKRIALAPLVALSSAVFAGPLTVTILHTNDLHGHVEPVTIRGKSYGGYARHVTLIKRQFAEDKYTLLLNGGDTFQGTLYFKVYQGLADATFMNLMGYHAMAVGNHEFDLGPKPFGEFIKNVQFPVLAANLDVSKEAALNGVKPSAVIEVKGEKIGLIGAVTPELPEISNPGPNVDLIELNASIQKAADELAAQKIDKIILLSHLGIETERKVAAAVRGIDLIIGGHSHTLLGTFTDENLRASGPYPIVLKNPDGNNTLIVTAWEWGKVLGKVRVSFDAKGAIQKWEGNPIVVDESVAEDPFAASLVRAFQEPIMAMKQQVVVTLSEPISREGSGNRETPMGNLIADAMLDAGKAAGAQVAFMNAGGIRANWDAGAVTFDKAIEVQPFGNQLVLLELTGAQLKEVLEFSVAEGGGGRFLQTSRGFSFTYDPSKPVGSKVVEMKLNGASVEPAKTYRAVFNNFTAGGGDGYAMLKPFPQVDLKIVDIDALLAYLKANPDPKPKVAGRIRINK